MAPLPLPAFQVPSCCLLSLLEKLCCKQPPTSACRPSLNLKILYLALDSIIVPNCFHRPSPSRPFPPRSANFFEASCNLAHVLTTTYHPISFLLCKLPFSFTIWKDIDASGHSTFHLNHFLGDLRSPSITSLDGQPGT